MRLELTTQNDFDAIIAFYDDVTERTSEMATYARWSKRKHPTIEGIRAYINEGSMYIYRELQPMAQAIWSLRTNC